MDEIVIEISSPLTTNCLIVAEYYRRISIAIAAGASLPDFPADALIPEAENAVIGEQMETIRIPCAPNALERWRRRGLWR